MTDPVLTKDWFAFADISQANIEKPTNPGVGYEIIRYYMDVEGGHAFDHLHYYPDTGFVYYDGIVDGWSEADRKWYTAKPGIKIIFESALATPTQCVAPIATAQAMIAKDQKKAYTSMDQIPTVTPMVHSSSKASDSTTRFITPIMITVSLAFLFVLAFSFRKSVTR